MMPKDKKTRIDCSDQVVFQVFSKKWKNGKITWTFWTSDRKNTNGLTTDKFEPVSFQKSKQPEPRTMIWQESTQEIR